MTLFVDSSAFYAAADTGDDSHGRAVEVLGSGQRLVTSDHVLIESRLLMRHRLDRHVAERFWSAIRGGSAGIELVGEGDLEVAWAIGEDSPTRTSRSSIGQASP